MRLDSIERIARALNEREVPFIIVGGLAVVAHGYGRQTQDLDLVIRLQPGCIRRAFEALATLGYHADPQRRARMIADKGMMVLGFHSEQHRETPIDVFASEPFDFAAEYAAAMVEEIATGVPVRIVRLDALLQLKREAGRPQDVAYVAELTQLHRQERDG